MEKQEMIIAIIELYDEITQLNTAIDDLRAKSFKPLQKENALNPIDGLMIEEGKKVLLNRCLREWNCCEANYCKDADTVTVLSFEKWVERKIRVEKLPKSISYNDFAEYVKKELWLIYENEKIKAVNVAKAQEE